MAETSSRTYQESYSGEDYRICDRENSNLRKHLLWCAQKLGTEDFKELKKRLSAQIDHDGVVEDNYDQLVEEVRVYAAFIVSLNRIIEDMMKRGRIPDDLREKAEGLLYHTRELEVFSKEISLIDYINNRKLNKDKANVT